MCNNLMLSGLFRAVALEYLYKPLTIVKTR